MGIVLSDLPRGSGYVMVGVWDKGQFRVNYVRELGSDYFERLGIG